MLLGVVMGLSDGISVLSASRNGISAVTAIRVGDLQPTNQTELNVAIAEQYGLNLYPQAVTLTSGVTRQLLVGLNGVTKSPDLKTVEISPKHSAKQKTKIKTIDESDRKNSTKSDKRSLMPSAYRTKIPTTDTPQTEPVKREEWEKQMLKLAFASLKDNPANAGEEMQTATFGDGKYRVIYHAPSEMLRIVDEVGNRGTLYKVERGKAVQVCLLAEDEKRSFEHDAKRHHLKGLQQG
jgi:hypothetical protein